MEAHTGSAACSAGCDLAGLLDNLTEGVYSLDAGAPYAFQYLNRRMAELAGRPAEDLLAGRTNWIDLIHEKDQSDWIDAVEACLEDHRPFDVCYRLQGPADQWREVRDRGVAVVDDRGDVVRIDGLLLEVTAHLRAQRQLERTQMLQSIGRLGAGIAHEINTPIQFIGDNIRFISDSFEQMSGLIREFQKLEQTARTECLDPQTIARLDELQDRADLEFLCDEVPKAIQQSLDGIKRVAAIVAAIRDFSHIDERRMQPGDLNKAIQSTLTLAHNELKYVADVQTELDSSLPLVMCCIDDLHQVFLNLFINAAHAIGDVVDRDSGQRGVIRVSTRRQGESAVITVSDTGTGIPDHVRERMYEPFFTTKGHDKGTGQGLLFVRTIIVEKHKGLLDCDTELGRGTTFTITLPIEGANPKRK